MQDLFVAVPVVIPGDEQVPLTIGSSIQTDNLELKLVSIQYNSSVFVFEAISKDNVLPLHFSLAAYMHPNNVLKNGKQAGAYL